MCMHAKTEWSYYSAQNRTDSHHAPVRINPFDFSGLMTLPLAPPSEKHLRASDIRAESCVRHKTELGHFGPEYKQSL